MFFFVVECCGNGENTPTTQPIPLAIEMMLNVKHGFFMVCFFRLQFLSLFPSFLQFRNECIQTKYQRKTSLPFLE